MWFPICPQPISAAHASAPLPDVQECEARGPPYWGEEERCLSAATGPGASFRCCRAAPEPPPPTPGRKGSAEGPAPPSRPSPGAARGAAEERAPAGSGGEPLAGGPADFLLISSRKPAPCARLRAALGRGEPSALYASCPTGGERGRGTLAAPEGTQASWAGASPAPGAGTLSREGVVLLQPRPFCRKRRDLWAGASGEGGEQGGARPQQSFPRGWCEAVSLALSEAVRVPECLMSSPAAGRRPEVGTGPKGPTGNVRPVPWVTGGMCRG